MATGLEILGAAAAIAQFIGYTISLGKDAAAVYKSSGGTTEEIEYRGNWIQRFQSENKEMLARDKKRLMPRDTTEESIHQLAQDSQDAAMELLNVLRSLRLQGPSQNDDFIKKASKSFGVAFKAKRWQQEINSKTQRLQKLREQLHEQLLRLISDRLTTQVPQGFEHVEETVRDAFAAADVKANDTRKELLHAINRPRRHDDIAPILRQMQDDFLDVSRCRKIAEILSSLRYDEIRDRFGKINDPTANTYDWIFNSATGQLPPVHFRKWLQQGDGIYWITGKAGSGKSTLMKYIAQHNETRNALEVWANGRKLFIASHYFFYAGTTMQKSYEGLIRSMLWGVLRQCSDAIPDVCASRWNADEDTSSMPWTLSELLQSLECLAASQLTIDGNKACFCFFIDGVDEYDGKERGYYDRPDHMTVIARLQSMTKASHIKICAASRPWEIFNQAFASSRTSGYSLQLHLHTKEDIRIFVQDKLRPHMPSGLLPSPKTFGRKRDSDTLSFLIDQIIEKAEGVFLWAYLVVQREIIPGLGRRERIASLGEKIALLPGDLHEYFYDIFRRIADRDQRNVARLFLTCTKAREPLPIAAAAVIMDEDPQKLAIKTPIDSQFPWADPDQVTKLRARINAQGQDLLLVHSSSVDDSPRRVRIPEELHRIEYLHKSVKDFFETPDVSSELQRHCGSGFDASLTLAACNVFLIKKLPTLETNAAQKMATNLSTEGLLALADVVHRPPNLELLGQLDQSMQYLWKKNQKRHWTNDIAAPQNYQVLDRGERDLLGHVIELGASKYADALLELQPGLISRKQGRPYLDYALRFAIFPTRTWPDPSTLDVLLKHGCNVNEKVYTENGRTVWDLHVSFLFNLPLQKALFDHENCHKIAWQLIDRGALKFADRTIVESTTGPKRQEAEDEIVVTGGHPSQKSARYESVVVPQAQSINFAFDLGGKKSTKTYKMEAMLLNLYGEYEGRRMCEKIASNSKAWLPWLKSWVGA